MPVARAHAEQSDRVPEGSGDHALDRPRAHRSSLRRRPRHEFSHARHGTRTAALAPRVPEGAESALELSRAVALRLLRADS